MADDLVIQKWRGPDTLKTWRELKVEHNAVVAQLAVMRAMVKKIRALIEESN